MVELNHIIGNQKAKEILQKAFLENRLSNALLFSGPDGIGKSLFAQALGYALLCEKEDLVQKNKIEKQIHPDFYVLKPEGKTEMHSMTSVRSMIDKVSKPPFEAKAKVFILHDVDRMLLSSANALLKTLEEPMLDTYLFLLTSKPSKLLPTILSRLTKISFSALSEKQVFEYIEKKWEKPQVMAHYIAKLCQGSIGKANNFITHPQSEKNIEILLDILSQENNLTYPHFSRLLQKMDGFFSDFKMLDLVFSFILMWFRDLHLVDLDENTYHLFFPEQQELLEKQKKKKIPSLENIHYHLEKAKFGIERNIKPSTCLEQFFMQIGWL